MATQPKQQKSNKRQVEQGLPVAGGELAKLIAQSFNAIRERQKQAQSWGASVVVQEQQVFLGVLKQLHDVAVKEIDTRSGREKLGLDAKKDEAKATA